MSFIYTALYSSNSINPASVVRIGQADVEIVFVLLTCGIVFQLIVLTFLLLLPSNRQLNSLSLVSFYSAMTIELGFAELLCCDCECVFCNSLVFDVSAFYFILWAVGAFLQSWGLSAGYQPRPQVVDRGTTARYGGQLRYI